MAAQAAANSETRGNQVTKEEVRAIILAHRETIADLKYTGSAAIEDTGSMMTHNTLVNSWLQCIDQVLELFE